MARIPNPHAGQTTEQLIREELADGGVPLVCDEPGCPAVSGRSPEALLRDRDGPAKACTGVHEGCGGRFVVADLDGPIGPVEPDVDGSRTEAEAEKRLDERRERHFDEEGHF